MDALFLILGLLIVVPMAFITTTAYHRAGWPEPFLPVITCGVIGWGVADLLQTLFAWLGW